MIVPMVRLRMAAPRSRLADLLRFIAASRLLHPVEPNEDPFLAAQGMTSATVGPEGEELAEAERLRGRVEEALASLSDRERQGVACPLTADDLRWLRAPLRLKVKGVAGSVLKSARCLARTQGELNEVVSYLRLFMTFTPLLRMIGASPDVEAIGVVFHKGEEESARSLTAALERVTEGAGVVLGAPDPDGGGGAALMVFPRSLLGRVRELAHETGVSPLKVPERYEQESFATTVARLFDARADLTTRLEGERERLALKGARWGALLAEALAGLTRALAPLRAERYVLFDDRVCWLAGWIPAERLPSFTAALVEALSGEATLHVSAPSGEETPVLLKNPPWAAPFERALALYALPRYGAFDPTTVSAALFVFYFGMTLGDIGYGLLLMGVALGVQRRYADRPGVVEAGRFATLAAGSAMFFGALYGELFGPLGRLAGLPGPLFDREHGADALLATTLVVGALAIGGGTLLGAMGAFRRGRPAEGIDRLADGALVAAMLLGGGLSLAGLSLDPAVALGATALGVKLFFCRPAANLLETPRLLSNVLSHARLMALGIAAVTLADLAHEMASLPDALLAGLLLGGGFHLLSFAIGVAGPAIHAGRLLFVEFYGQFYEAGGRPYTPFG